MKKGGKDNEKTSCKAKQEEYVDRDYEKEISNREVLGASLNEKKLTDSPGNQADIRVRKRCLLEGLFAALRTLSNSPKAVRTRCRICRRTLLRKQ